METIKPARCQVCDAWRGESDCYPLDFSGDGSEETVYVCTDCVDAANGPGRWGTYHDLEDLAYGLAAEAMSGDSSYEDDSMSSESCGYIARFGRVLYMCDSQGFRRSEIYATPEEAGREFDSLYEDGCGADEYDAYMSWEHGRCSVAFNGKYVGEYPSERRAMAAVSVEAIKSGYFPDLWFVSDHGNLVRRTYWPFHEQ